MSQTSRLIAVFSWQWWTVLSRAATTETSPIRDLTVAARRRVFRELHERGCFVIPNPWDVGSARYLQYLGFPALATTSAGFAFSQGLPDSGDASVTARDRSS